ncbi:MAG TPA: AAA family ATPase, partial [Bacteroidales bacterium]|nr:AAA family ATPase [Bacteroidales bacterium]
MKPTKRLDIGNSDFKSIIENNNYYVDKSLLIEEIIEAQKQIILLPRPRRFGKTLNLSMLKYYFEIDKPKNEALFTELNIWKSSSEVKARRGKHPVIFLSFKDAKAKSWDETFLFIKDELVKLYSTHDYLVTNNVLKAHELATYHEILTKKASSVDYANSVKNLSEYLYRFYNEKVVILIDEYDTPIQAGYKKFYDDAISFMRNLMSGAYKDNSYLYKGVITGILRVSKETIFSGLNNVSVYSILDLSFADKFGFTEPETKQIMHDFDVTTDYEEVKKWYDGYKIGETTDIYNPWSILNY